MCLCVCVNIGYELVYILIIYTIPFIPYTTILDITPGILYPSSYLDGKFGSESEFVQYILFTGSSRVIFLRRFILILFF